jgi:uncharacterized protein YjbI with pentapeptide repeats
MERDSSYKTRLLQGESHRGKPQRADLRGAILGVANLGGTPLRGATLRGADLGEANLCEADLGEANLCEADLSRAILQNASLLTSRLINANFDGAILTEACLWKTQRAGWSIKGVICESIHWDAEKEKLDTFELGEFERLYSEKARVRIKYPGGSCHNQRVE